MRIFITPEKKSLQKFFQINCLVHLGVPSIQSHPSKMSKINKLFNFFKREEV